MDFTRFKPDIKANFTVAMYSYAIKCNALVYTRKVPLSK